MAGKAGKTSKLPISNTTYTPSQLQQPNRQVTGKPSLK